jgi:isopentenyl-diphosphate delta-isomerase
MTETALGAARRVSYDDEPLILVDEHDQPVGSASKQACHDGDGQLHRAFSVFLFDASGRLLIQRRAADKRLWPGFWANSCCSHPRLGEEMEAATQRRISEELGVSVPLTFLYKFIYHAHYLDRGAEHELCWVYAGRVTPQRVEANPAELAAWQMASVSEVEAMMNDPERAVAPWFRLEWQALAGTHREALHEALGLSVFG